MRTRPRPHALGLPLVALYITGGYANLGRGQEPEILAPALAAPPHEQTLNALQCTGERYLRLARFERVQASGEISPAAERPSSVAVLALAHGRRLNWSMPSTPSPANRPAMTEILFIVEEAPEGGYTARAVGASMFTEADDLE